MKNSILAYISAALMLAVAGCTADFAEPVYSVEADGKITFTVGVSIPDAQAMATRGGVLDGVNERPAGDYLSGLNFYMFVFEDNGSPQSNYLRELVYGKDIIPVNEVNPVPPMVGETDTDHSYKDGTGKGLVKFKATLDGTAENAILHLVVTSDPKFEEQLLDVPDRSEFGIFAGTSGLFTSDKEAYWKRIELDGPINKDNAEDIQTKLKHVNLVRNFARVTLKVNLGTESAKIVGGFTALDFVIVNAVGSGYVAAYNENLSDGLPGFVEFEEKDAQGNSKMRSYGDLAKTEKYVPARHPVSDRVNPDDDLSWIGGFEAGTALKIGPRFTFERSVQNEHHTFVIVKGLFDGDTDPVYFKLDIGAKDSAIDNGTPFGIFENYHLIRNMSYDITITQILNKSIGHKSAEGAIGAPPSNNVSTSIETRPLKDINDGIDRMSVSQATIVIVDTEVLEDGVPKVDASGKVMLEPSVKDFDMKWLYTENYQSTDPSRPSKNVSNEVKWNYPGYEFAFVDGKDPDGIIKSWSGNNGKTSQNVTPTWDSNSAASDAKTFDNGWMGFTLNFNLPDDIVRQKTIRFYRRDGLTRDVVFISHNRWEFVNNSPEKYKSNIEVYPGAYSSLEGTMPYETLDEMREYVDPGYVGSQRGAQLTVMFELPPALPEAIFPLDFTIGSNRQNIENAYVGNAVAVWGKSLFENSDNLIGVLRMQFVKTVTWADYCKHRIVCARFVTNNDVYAETEVGNVSETWVRVSNPYFTIGEDNFYRQSHEDDTDPTRTRWYWNFSYPEWDAYYKNHVDYVAGDLNDLHFSDYVKGTFNENNTNYGTYMAIGNGKADGDGSADNPAFWFNVNTDMSQSEKGYTATMVIRNSHDKASYYKAGLPNIGTHWYPRDIHVRLCFEDGSYDEKVYENRDDHSNLWRTVKDGIVTFDIPVGKQINEVKIWSTIGNETDFRHQSLTRYYWIDFSLAEK